MTDEEMVTEVHDEAMDLGHAGKNRIMLERCGNRAAHARSRLLTRLAQLRAVERAARELVAADPMQFCDALRTALANVGEG